MNTARELNVGCVMRANCGQLWSAGPIQATDVRQEPPATITPRPCRHFAQPLSHINQNYLSTILTPIFKIKWSPVLAKFGIAVDHDPVIRRILWPRMYPQIYINYATIIALIVPARSNNQFRSDYKFWKPILSQSRRVHFWTIALDLWECALDLGSVIEYSHPDGRPFDILMTCR